MGGSGKFWTWLLTGILMVILVVVINLSLGKITYRKDLTDDQRYILQDEARSIAARIEDTCTVTAYLSDPLPTYLRHMPEVLKTRMDEFRDASGNYLRYVVVNPDELTTSEQEALAERGIKPSPLQDREEGKVSQGLYYAWLKFEYGPKEELVSLFQIGQDVLSDLEFRRALPFQICSRLTKLTATDLEVGVMAEKRIPAQELQAPKEQGGLGKDPTDSLSTIKARIESHLEKAADVQTKGGPVSESIDALVVFRPTDFTERVVFEIDQALMRGQNVVILLDSFSTLDPDRIVTDYVSNLRAGRPIRVRPIESGMASWLKHFGVTIEPGYLEDVNCPSQQGLQRKVEMTPSGPRQVLKKVTNCFPGVVVASERDLDKNETGQINSDHPSVAGLGNIGTLFPAALHFDAGALKANSPDAEGEVVVRTADTVFRRELEGDSVTLVTELEQRKIPDEGQGEWPLLISISGEFRSFFAGKTYGEGDAASDRPPIGTDPDGNPLPATGSEAAKLESSVDSGQLWIFADSDFASDMTFLNPGGRNPLGPGAQMMGVAASRALQQANTALVNVVDQMTLGNDLIEIRKPNLTDRTVRRTEMTEDRDDIRWKALAYGPVLVILFGVLMWILRKVTTGASIEVASDRRVLVDEPVQEDSE